MQSYWERETLRHFDLIVVGGGIVGHSTALFYAESHPDARIAILERGLFPEGASTKNAGFACFGSIAELEHDLESLGAQRTVELVLKRFSGLQLLRQTLGDQAIDYREVGGYELCFEAPDLERINFFNDLLEPALGARPYSVVQNNGFGFSDRVHSMIKNALEGTIDTGKMMAALHKIIETEFRLSELVELVDKGAEHCHIRLENQNIKVIPDWADNNFPILITDQKFDPSIFLAIVYFKLGNTEKAIKLIDEDHELFSLLYLYGLIQNGFDIRQDVLAQFWQKIEEPNKCLFTHHLGIYDSIEGQLDWYTGVINALPEGTAKYYLIHQRNQLQFDYNPGLRPQIDFESRPQIAEPFHALLAYDNAMLRYNSGIANNDQESLDEIEMAFKNFIEVCVDRDEELRASLVHMDLAEIELIQAKYEIAHKSVNASLLILKKWEIPYFMARASVLKGRILYSWSKNGAPQYYKSSINAYQNALKVFTPSEFPNECAEIKSNLALLYTDMASSDREQPMWYALSASCFKEALELFESTRDYTNLSEVAHNYATALMNFPEAKLHDNLEKAKQYFELALDHRSARELPNQRVMTMLNFLELQFKLHNNNPQEEEMRLKQMSSMIEEIKTLTEDKNTLELADDFALRVNTLKDWMKNA